MTPSHVGVASKNPGHSELVNRDFDCDLGTLFGVSFLFILELLPRLTCTGLECELISWWFTRTSPYELHLLLKR